MSEESIAGFADSAQATEAERAPTPRKEAKKTVDISTRFTLDNINKNGSKKRTLKIKVNTFTGLKATTFPAGTYTKPPLFS